MHEDQGQDLQHNDYKDRISRPECRHITTYDLNELMKIKHVTDNDIRCKHLFFWNCELNM